MAKRAYRWRNIRFGRRLPNDPVLREKVLADEARILARLSGPVTTRKATPEELARLR